MTIKDAARLTGISQANIRYYESQGLIEPARSENGYRDYAAADVELLLRVKLLRVLGISIEDIKSLQEGKSGLEVVLAIRLEEIDRAVGELGRSKAVCEELKSTGASFDNLDARHYLSLLEQMNSTSISQDVLPRVKAPWRRYFARMFDYALCSLLLGLVEVFVLKLDVWSMIGSSTWDLYDLLRAVLVYLALVAVEPWLLSRFGTTPGKWILGLSVTDMEDRKLTVREARKRTMGAIWHGIGWGIPIYTYICLWRSAVKCGGGEELPWEETSVLHLKKPRVWRALVMAASYFGVVVLMALVLMTPVRDLVPHKGDLTLAQFCENYNTLAEETGVGTDEVRLNSKGQWIFMSTFGENSYEVVDENHIMYDNLPELEFVEEDGVLKEVSYSWAYQTSWESEAYNAVADFYDEMRLIAWAFACARTEEGSLSDGWEEIARWTGDGNEYISFTLNVEDAVVVSQVEYSGFERKEYMHGYSGRMGGYKLRPISGAEEYYCTLEFSVSCP